MIETGYLTLVVTLGITLILSALLILMPLWFAPRDPPTTSMHAGKMRVLAYFGALGLGFLLLEIAFLQKFILLLHHPLYAAAVVLASFLLSAGMGSAFAQRYAGTLRDRRVMTLAGAGIIATGLVYLLLLPPVMALAASWPPFARILLSIALIAPLGFAMGMPFPLGLAALRAAPSALTPWAWGINGCMSVVSAVLASLLAIHFGFNVVILIALACYWLAILSFPRPTGDLARSV